MHQSIGENDTAQEQASRVLNGSFKPVRCYQVVEHDWQGDTCLSALQSMNSLPADEPVTAMPMARDRRRTKYCDKIESDGR